MSWNLPGAPWLIAHKSMLTVNKPKMFTICGQDYVLWKNQKGEVSALENICPHLGAKLSNGWICEKTNTISIMMPYCCVRTHPTFDVFSVYLLSKNSKIMVGSAHPTK